MLGGKHEGLAVRPDVRIEDVLPTLARDREDFVRGILGKFHDEKFDRDKAVVRIGILGKRRQLHYSIEEGEGTQTLTDGTTMRVADGGIGVRVQLDALSYLEGIERVRIDIGHIASAFERGSNFSHG
jgi:hypothetical protein